MNQREFDIVVFGATGFTGRLVAQYLAVRQLHLNMLTERRDLEIMLNGSSAEERDTQLARAQQRYETELSNLLQPQQLVAYQALRINFTAHRLK